MRLFRQLVPRSWDSTVEEVGRALREWSEARG
jgi:hypothetical protein